MPWFIIIFFCGLTTVICLMSQSYSKTMSLVLCLMFSITTSLYYFNGMDWLNYYYVFDLFKHDFELRYDLLFNAYFYIAANTIGNYQLTIFLFYIFSFYTIFRLTCKSSITINGPAFITCIVLLGGLSLVLDQIRQFGAICISFFALNSLLANNRRSFYRYIIVAALFHYSALFVLLFRIFFSMTKKNLLISGGVIVTSFVFLGSIVLFNLGLVANIPVIGMELYRKAIIYTRDLNSFQAEIGFGILVDILIISYFTLRRRTDNCLDNLWGLAFISACFHIGFYFMPAFSRFNYFAILPLAYLFGHALATNRGRLGIIQVGVILCSISLMVIIVMTKSLSDPNRPSLDNYTYDAFFFDAQKLDELRSNRCAELEIDVSEFCAQY